MNESEIEALLSALPARPPSAKLLRQVEADLALDSQWFRPASARTLWRRGSAPLVWAGLGAAAALAVMALSPLAVKESTQTVPEQFALLPVGTIREVVRTENDGIRFNEDSQTHEQRLRLYSVERQAWLDARDGARITIELPREESLVLPISYQ